MDNNTTPYYAWIVSTLRMEDYLGTVPQLHVFNINTSPRELWLFDLYNI